MAGDHTRVDHDRPELAPWEDSRPEDLRVALDGLLVPWWVAGGWALDLFLGRETRRHADLDVALLRRDQHELHRTLEGWDLRYSAAGRLRPWPAGLSLELPVHGIWARRPGGSHWFCEFLLNEDDGERWL